MNKRRKRWIQMILFGIFTLLTILFFILGFHRKPQYIQNFEEEEYGQEKPFVPPIMIENGLAIYTAGTGDPVLLFPYPHGHTKEPMIQGPIAEILVDLGYMVVTFDVPGAYRSTREPVGDMDEMLSATEETLERLGIQTPVNVMGHSMGGLAALAFAVENPEKTQRLVLSNSVSGFPAALDCGFPGSTFRPSQVEFWQIIVWGIRVNSGRADLVLHKKLYNLMSGASYYDKEFFSPIEIDEDDTEKGVPIRMIWSRNMYAGLSYADRLGQVQAPALILAGRHDPQAAFSCSEELVDGIPDSHLIIFEESGHYPYIEEETLFKEALDEFLKES